MAAYKRLCAIKSRNIIHFLISIPIMGSNATFSNKQISTPGENETLLCDIIIGGPKTYFNRD